MKKIMFLMILFFTFENAQASIDAAKRRSNGLLRFIVEHQGVSDFALHSVMGARCSRYMPDSESKIICREAVKTMITILDYDVLVSYEKARKEQTEAEWTPKSFVFVAFKRNLIQLLNSPKTETYLNDLNQKLFAQVTGTTNDINIWEVTKSYFTTNYMTSLVMATLFQDTSMMKLHLAYLQEAKVTGSEHFERNKELLSRVIGTINLILDTSEEHYRELFYPKEIQKDLNRNIYHFYVPLFLARALELHKFTKKESRDAALMLTLSYEFITSANDYRYLYRDPEVITNRGKLKDIFGGYCGSNIGVRGMNFYKSFEGIRAAFERSTEDGVNLLIRD